MTSFMAVNAHWLEVIGEQSGSGNHKKVKLHADLIGFHKSMEGTLESTLPIAFYSLKID
jgi:hypothetical protein